MIALILGVLVVAALLLALFNHQQARHYRDAFEAARDSVDYHVRERAIAQRRYAVAMDGLRDIEAMATPNMAHIGVRMATKARDARSASYLL